MVEAIQPARGPAVWIGSDLARSDDWNIRLTAEDIGELEDALAGVEGKNIPVHEITADDFPLPRLARLPFYRRGGRAFARGCAV